VELEVGVRMDATNESYYEDAFIDTTFLGRRLVGTPETRTAGVMSANWAGTRDARAHQYRLQTEASLGNLLEREFAGFSYRAVGTDWTWIVDPNLEHRHDQTFGRSLDELRAAFGGRVRRSFADDLTAAELGARADLLRTEGAGSEFQPDRNGLALTTSIDHLGLLGEEWRVGYRLSVRAFPDSTVRDHEEHLLETRWKSGGSSRWASIDATGTRRIAMHEAPTSRDNFWIGEAALEARTDVRGPWSTGARAELEVTHYDVEDSTLYFDYQVARARAILRCEPSLRWSIELAPRVEALFATLDPGEEYREVGGVMDLEFLDRGSWWSVSPAAGWREYEDVPAAGPRSPPLHSSYAFYAIDMIADQRLPAGFRFKALGSFRWESHVDPAQDARSVYASLELSRALF
jgi:hypothetical protein